jgi:O-methyltransferase
MQALRQIIRSFGFDIQRYAKPGQERFPPAVEAEFKELYKEFRPYTMLQWVKLYNAYKASLYVAKNKLPGAIVECGVWRGGCVGLMLATLAKHGHTDADVYLYDTFTGMSEPGPEDRHSRKGTAANDIFAAKEKKGEGWCHGDLNDVTAVIAKSGYPQDRIHFVAGKVEDTIPATIPQAISLLRLDTDWYESTKQEIEHLYPRLIKGGILIVDDYGVWDGSRKAIDEYFAANNITPFWMFDETVAAATTIKI